MDKDEIIKRIRNLVKVEQDGPDFRITIAGCHFMWYGADHVLAKERAKYIQGKINLTVLNEN